MEAKETILFPKEFSKPTCIFTKAQDWLGLLGAASSHEDRQRKTAQLSRALRKIVTDNKVSGPYMFAVLCRVPWQLWCVGQSLSAAGFYVADPVSAREPVSGGGEDAAHIVCASVQQNDWFKLLERPRDIREGDDDWNMRFHNFESMDLPHFDFASQLTTWFLHRFTRIGDTVWHINVKKTSQGNPAVSHFALSALACGRTVAVSVDEEYDECVSAQLQYAEVYANQNQMFLDFDAPARVFTILQLAVVTTSLDDDDDETSTTCLIKSSVPLPSSEIVDSVELHKDFKVKQSALKTVDGDAIGLGVFTLKKFKSGEDFGVLALHSRTSPVTSAQTVTHR
jgi:hypothetical protein